MVESWLSQGSSAMLIIKRYEWHFSMILSDKTEQLSDAPY
ncbi:hypothetical protein CZ794_00145 [Psychrobacter sp. JB385]|nr:hypothetical protein CZ794_00145 [Psychrobacter sp. JB385]